MKYIVLKQRTSTFLTSHRHTMVRQKDEIAELLQISGKKIYYFHLIFLILKNIIVQKYTFHMFALFSCMTLRQK